MKVGVVVLNYKNYTETFKCVDSILLQKNIDFKIVVVDNGSGNESAYELHKKYENEPKVEVIEVKENVGFAKGNNIGIKRLRDEGYEYIFLSNSDILFDRDDVLASMVFSHMRAKEENPKVNIGLVNQNVRNTDYSEAVHAYFKKKLLRLRMLKTFMFVGYKKKKASLKNKKEVKKHNFKEDNSYNIHKDFYIVTGCANMLTPDYFKAYDGMFPKTFLYSEEYATILLLNCANLCTMHVNTKPFIHIGGASSDEYAKNKKVKNASKKHIIKLMFTPFLYGKAKKLTRDLASLAMASKYVYSVKG